MHEHLTQWWNSVPLRNKITGVTVMLLTLGLLVAGLGTMSVLRNYLISEVDAKITANVRALASTIELEGTDCQIAKVYADYYLAVVSPDAQLMCSNSKASAESPDVSGLTLAKVTANDGAFSLYNAQRTSQWRVIAVPVQNATNEQLTVIVGINLDDTNSLISNYAATFLFFGFTVVVLGGALTRLLVTTTFGPLREVENTAARFAAGDFSQRLGGGTPNTEVGRLNASLNTMLSRIDSAFADRAKTIDQMRRFVGDASHELRTPLVSVRGYAELYRMGALTKPEDVAQAMERIEKEAIRMGSLVGDLLELARIDEAKPLHLAPVDLVPLASDAALDAMASSPDREVRVIVNDPIHSATGNSADATGEVELRATSRTSSQATGPIGFAGQTLARLRPRRPRPTKEVEVEVGETEPPTVSRAIVLAEENKIRQVVTNLMGNALRFTDSDSPIEIEITVDEPNDSAIIALVDHGEGIPPQIREKIFQRFWRADSSRNRDTGGSGLGLAIVASIVASHKGTVDVVETPGGGSTFRVRLPLLHPDTPLPEVPNSL
jgi:two-component system OmpR family sensor kinase